MLARWRYSRLINRFNQSRDPVVKFVIFRNILDNPAMLAIANEVYQQLNRANVGLNQFAHPLFDMLSASIWRFHPSSEHKIAVIQMVISKVGIGLTEGTLSQLYADHYDIQRSLLENYSDKMDWAVERRVKLTLLQLSSNDDKRQFINKVFQCLGKSIHKLYHRINIFRDIEPYIDAALADELFKQYFASQSDKLFMFHNYYTEKQHIGPVYGIKPGEKFKVVSPTDKVAEALVTCIHRLNMLSQKMDAIFTLNPQELQISQLIKSCNIELENAYTIRHSINLNKETFPEYEQLYEQRLIDAMKRLETSAKNRINGLKTQLPRTLSQSSITTPLLSVGSYSSTRHASALGNNDDSPDDEEKYSAYVRDSISHNKL